MIANKIPEVLYEMIFNDNYSSILIDGAWGCGKTYSVAEFREKLKEKKAKITYTSLFGYELLDEINTDIYVQLHKGEEILKKGLTIVSKAIKPIVDLETVTDELTNNILKKEIKSADENKIIIIDDIERLSKNIQFSDLFGYISNLICRGCVVISIVSSQNISKDREKDFEYFFFF